MLQCDCLTVLCFTLNHYFDPFALRMAKTHGVFGHFKCNGVKNPCKELPHVLYCLAKPKLQAYTLLSLLVTLTLDYKFATVYSYIKVTSTVHQNP